MPLNEKLMLHDFLGDHHRAFSLEVDRQTGDATSHQGGCLLLFDERLLGNLSIVVQSSRYCTQEGWNPWPQAHRKLNTVTKADKFPLPRIDDSCVEPDTFPV